MRCEVVNLCPVVAPRTRVREPHLRQQIVVPISHRAEDNVCASFDNWLCLRVKHHAAIMAISHAQLLTKDYESAIRAVSDECARLARTEHSLSTLALIDIRLSDLIMQVKLTVVTHLNLECRASHLTW